MHLDNRKRRILQAIIDEYINTAEPVGSRSIAKKHELGLSSATIRNEMADLEEMGYLAQLHTSSGRMPSDKGYRLYVDNLMEVRDLTLEEIRTVSNELNLKINELSALIKHASTVISRLTKYTAVVLTPKNEDCQIRKIETVLIDSKKVFVIVVSNSGTMKNCVANLASRIDKDELIQITTVLQKNLCGKTLAQSNQLEFERIRKEFLTYAEKESILNPILDAVLECFMQMNHSEIYLEGAANILNFPEFRNIERAREFLGILEEKKSISSVLSELSKGNHIKMLIGEENPIDEIKECSIVSTTYSTGDIVLGTIGIIGPKRMEYSKVVSTIEYINKLIAKELGNLVDPHDDEK